MTTVVDIADVAVVKDDDATLITYSLGSCVGVSIWDPVVRVGGLLHFMLPDSRALPDKAKLAPAMFCDTGITDLFFSAYELGAVKRRLVVKVAGGSQLLDAGEEYGVGKRNYLALRKLFWKNGIVIEREDVGGSVSRTLFMDVSTGGVTVRTRAGEVAL